MMNERKSTKDGKNKMKDVVDGSCQNQSC